MKIEDDGCVHSTFLIQGTPTGRLASNKPNVQNIPRDKDLRSTFMARPGYRLLEVDLNQAELRSLACTSGDKYLVDLYNASEEEGRSLHDEMAEFLAERAGDNYDRNNLDLYDGDRKRMRAKAVNFGIPYGREAGSLAEEFSVPTVEAQSWITGWFAKAKGAHDFLMACRRAAMHGKPITTCFGYVKRHRLVTRENIHDLMNQASNFPHQNIASSINAHGAFTVELPEEMYFASKGIELSVNYDTHLVNLVHDCCVFEVPDDDATVKEVSRIVRQAMVEVPPQWGLTRVPFIADSKIGYLWGRLEKEKL
jgi:DNA polymerase-1